MYLDEIEQDEVLTESQKTMSTVSQIGFDV
jgi:hypothetical protein